MAVDHVEVIAEVGVLFLKLLVVEPLLEGLLDVFAANGKHVFGVVTAGLLEAPSGRVVEVETARTWAQVALLEVVPNVKTGESLCLLDQTIAARVVIFNALGDHPVFQGILLSFGAGLSHVAAHSNVNNNVGDVVYDL